MAITRQTTQTLASAEINDEYGVDVTVHVGREHLTVKLTLVEALELANEINMSVIEAQRASTADGAS